jgi:rod shape determining protein RodA
MNWRNTPTREFDFVLVMAAVGLIVYGLLLIYSGSLNTYGDPGLSPAHPVTRQAMFAIFGLTAMLIVSRFEYRILGPLSVTLYVVSIAALVFVLFAGSSEYGSRRWIEVQGTQIQPSEIAKTCTVIMLAKYFSDNEEQVRSFRVFAISLAITAVPALLVMVEPDMGSALVFFALWLAMALVAGARPLHLAGLLAFVAVAAPLALLELAHGYQRERIFIWWDPEKDPTGSGFNILQAEISTGAGRLFGQGFTHGTQTQLDYLRTQTTDYVFSVGAEELGFVGAMVLFTLFVVLLFRMIHIASRADDAFGRLIAIGVTAFVLFQAFVNIGVNIRLMPVTGVPLPFVSLGGSSLVTLLASIGILLSILGHRRRRPRRA